MIGNQLSVIKRGADGAGTALQDVCVDHGGLHIFMPKQLLHGSDIVAILEQVGAVNDN